jgi:catechol 2,3-dioxygenase-like lactoylglutathione lyase family enzyme
MHIESIPVLPVAHLPTALEFYRDLGFEVEAFDAGYGWVRHDGQELFHVRQVAELHTSNSGVYLHVAAADELYSLWEHEPSVKNAIEDTPWGMREFSISDPSGNVLRIGRNL